MSGSPNTALDWLTELPIAHRGLHDADRKIYENTVSAMLAAANAGFAMELDVQLSGDGEAMVFHDKDLTRMCGLKQKVADLTAAELSRIHVLDSDDTVRSLPKILSAVGGKTPVIIELKGNPPHDEGLAKAVVQALADYDGKAAVMSFSQDILVALNAHNCVHPVGLTALGGPETLEEHRTAYAHDISFVSYDVNALPNPFVEEVKRVHSMPVITWTVRNEDAAKLTYTHADQITFEGFDPRTI